MVMAALWSARCQRESENILADTSRSFFLSGDVGALTIPRICVIWDSVQLHLVLLSSSSMMTPQKWITNNSEESPGDEEIASYISCTKVMWFICRMPSHVASSHNFSISVHFEWLWQGLGWDRRDLAAIMSIAGRRYMYERAKSILH